MKTITVEDFSRGITSDIRDKRAGYVKMLKHFDLLTRPNTLTPYHSSVNADGFSSGNQLTDFISYYDTNNTIWGIGTAAAGYIKLLFKMPGTSTWSSTSNNISANGKVLISGTFKDYHSKFYGGSTDGKVFKADPAGGAWVDDDGAGLSSSLTSNGVVHSKDDVLYYGAGNKIASNNNGSWNASALTLPTRFVVSTICEYGNYLAIGCRTSTVPYGKSVVYLWDRDTTLNTLSESIDFGTGYLNTIEQVEGVLIGISTRNNLLYNLPDKFIFRQYAGGVADVFIEMLSSSRTGVGFPRGQRENQRLYFMAEMTIDGVLNNGIWALGKDNTGKWTLWFDRLPNNDTAIALGSMAGFIVTGDYAMISYNDGGFQLTETSTNATAYSSSSILETVINPNIPVVDYSNNKQLMTVAVSYDSLPSGGQVVIKYKVNGGGWITVFTETTAGKCLTEMTYDASGTAFTAGNEYQFRIESMGGVMITGLKYKYEILKSLI